MPASKIATCTYCGTRAALILSGTERHELACSACGAPLHDLKRLKTEVVDVEAHRPPRKGRQAPRREVHATPLPHWETVAKKPKKRKKSRKSLAKRVFKEAIDVLEDIFD
jgi:hypothetical protein